MTLRCKRTIGKRRICLLVLGLSLALGLFASGQPLPAQDEGTRVPPPPVLKRRANRAPDADFRSPMKASTDNAGAAGDNQPMGWRRRQFLEGGQLGGQFGRARRLNNVNGDGLGRQAGGLGGRGGLGGPAGGLGAPGGLAAQAGTAGILSGGRRRALDLTPLNLSAEQKSRIKEIRAASKERAKDVRTNLQEHQRNLRSLMFDPQASDAEIRAERRQLRQAQDQLDELNLDDWLRIRAQLTAEQRQRLPDVAPAAANRPQLGTAVGEKN